MTRAIVEPNLPTLAEQINEAHRLCESSFVQGVQHAIRAGELLIEAKALCKHGEWIDWLTANCEVSERTAQAYMRVARNREALESKAQRVADLPFREAIALLAEPKSSDGLEYVRAQSKRVFAELGVIVDSPDATLGDLANVAHVAAELQNAWTEVKLRCERIAGDLLKHNRPQKPLSDAERAELDRLEGIIESALKDIPQRLHSRYLELALEAAEGRP